MPDRSEMNRHVEAAIRELREAIASGNCGTCADLLSQEADHLEMFMDLSGKVTELVAVQETVTESFTEGNERADRRLAAVAPAPQAPRARGGLGLADMASDMWRTRVRVTDILTLGRR